MLISLVFLIPVVAFIAGRCIKPGVERWPQTALLTLALFAIGLAAASPFLTSRAVGSSEAYNYSLAVADAVTQMRAGEIPPLVGQTQYAFNGRVHPLRNAPYLFYLAGGLDFLTAHHLSFWELQNLSLALSLIGAVFAGYIGLRWGTGCPRWLAVGLAAIYGLSPSLLTASTVNLYMTIHAAVFVPLALGACLRHCRYPSFINDVALAAAVAATWLAHPPVALWLTLAVGLIRGLILWHNPAWQARLGLLGAVVLFAALSAFVFVSVATLEFDLNFFRSEKIIHDDYVAAAMGNVHAGFPGALLPVSRQANLLTDFQFGYISWGLLAVAFVSWVRLRTTNKVDEARRLAGAGLIGSSLLLLALTLPVPYLTRWLWSQTPVEVQTLTNVWPMQRLYLVATALTIFAAALLWRPRWPARKFGRQLLVASCALIALWTLWEAQKFISRGYGLRWSRDQTTRQHLSSNLDLTITSYSFLGIPSTFLNGVMDPRLEFRLLNSQQEEITSLLKAAEATASVIAQGEVSLSKNAADATLVTGSIKLLLEPSRRYLLTFEFLTPPFTGELKLVGPAFLRHYQLPSAGLSQGFGMGKDQPHSLSLWTSRDRPEEIEVQLISSHLSFPLAAGTKLASYTLMSIAQERLPVRVDSWLPLRFTVETAGDDSFVVTPRCYIRGYEAKVNGRSVRPVRSPDGQVMLPVPQGTSVVELRYIGPPHLLEAFWLSALAWLGLCVWQTGRVAGLNWSQLLVRRPLAALSRITATLFRFRFALLGTAAVAIVTGIVWIQRDFYLKSVGPVRIRVLLPLDEMGRQQPILVTGRHGAGTNVFVSYVDNRHIRIGADIWGQLHLSEPIAINYSQVQDFVINSSALYPLDHPRIRPLSPLVQDQLRNDFRVELNGHPVLALQQSAYESTVAEVTVGETRIGGSMTQPRFTGKILQVERLPFPHVLVLASDQKAQLRLTFPRGAKGTSETLLSLGSSDEDRVCSVSYLDDRLLRFAERAHDGTVIATTDLTYNPRQHHDLEFAFGRPPGSETFAIRWKFDGRHVLGPKSLEPVHEPVVIVTGLARTEIPGIGVRFTGPELTATAGLKITSTHLETSGPLRLIVTLPPNRLGRPEPLVTTGQTGRGDFAYIVYVDSQHVRFGLDHWGVGGALSEPLPLDYRLPHEIEISLGSLYPDEKDPAWQGVAPAERAQLKSTMEIRLNGKSVLRAAMAAHPSTAAEITVGLNRIGGSNCDPAFSGEVHLIQYLGLPPPTMPRGR